MKAIIFPGQGSQTVGMGKEFFEKFELVKKLFKDADEILEYNLSNIITDVTISIKIIKDGQESETTDIPEKIISHLIHKNLRQEFSVVFFKYFFLMNVLRVF